MTPLIYNISLLAGTALVGSGLAMFSIPVALVAVGSIVIAMTLIGAFFSRKG